MKELVDSARTVGGVPHLIGNEWIDEVRWNTMRRPGSCPDGQHADVPDEGEGGDCRYRVNQSQVELKAIATDSVS